MFYLCNSTKGVMYRVCPNFEVRLTAEKNFYLRLRVERMHAFSVFTEKYLRSHGCSGINFSEMVVCANPKTEIQIEIIETEVIGIQIDFVMKKIFLFFSGNLVCLQ